jgi:hypothetical protein
MPDTGLAMLNVPGLLRQGSILQPLQTRQKLGGGVETAALKRPS